MEDTYLNQKKRKPPNRPKGLKYRPRQSRPPKSEPERFITADHRAEFALVLKENEEISIVEEFGEHFCSTKRCNSIFSDLPNVQYSRAVDEHLSSFIKTQYSLHPAKASRPTTAVLTLLLNESSNIREMVEKVCDCVEYPYRLYVDAWAITATGVEPLE